MDEVKELDPILEQLLRATHTHEASDLHVKADAPPRLRVQGELRKIKAPLMTPEVTENMVRSTMSEPEWEEFQIKLEKDYSLEIRDVARFRINAFYTRGRVGLVARRLSSMPPSLDSLGVPESLNDLALQKNGLIVVSGATGSGKSTTLAAMINHINKNSSKNIITIEDPIEIVHQDIRSSIVQRELGADTHNYGNALHSALRQDPDIILVGEMRHEETVRTALEAAETGHLVLTTLHTNTAPETVNRILSFFQPHEREQVRKTLSDSLRGVVCQRLVPNLEKTKRLPVIEVLVNKGRVPEALVKPDQHDLYEIMNAGNGYGMQTFDADLLRLYSQGLISKETGESNAHDAQNFAVKSRHM
jgi:twitching motility protein PilT